MPHNTPSFWYPKDKIDLPFKVKMLKPLSCLYRIGFTIHQGMRDAKKAEIPVICIGNLSVGGTGKTPTCISFVQHLLETGLFKAPYFLMRGYGGAERGPVIVDLDKHSAWDVGDEPLILAQHAPTIISADRYAGAQLAAAQGADVVIMDDGLQNPGIHKDLKIIVVNGEMGFGNGLMIPAGPLREPLASGLKKADSFFFIGQDASKAKKLLPEDVPVFDAKLEADKAKLPDKKQKYLAFAGLGYPEKFFNFLTDELGYDIVETLAFADHCPYRRQDVQDLRKRAKQQDALLITTEKDYLRLPRGYKDDIFTVPVSMTFKAPKKLQTFIKEALAA